jgi:putative transposase
MGQYAQNAGAVYRRKYRSLPIMADHLHLLVEADPTLCRAEIVHGLKGSRSSVLRAEFVCSRSRWPALGSHGYYAGRVGAASAAVVRKYIEGHKRK